jgi:hypothetical protein
MNFKVEEYEKYMKVLETVDRYNLEYDAEKIVRMNTGRAKKDDIQAEVIRVLNNGSWRGGYCKKLFVRAGMGYLFQTPKPIVETPRLVDTVPKPNLNKTIHQETVVSKKNTVKSNAEATSLKTKTAKENINNNPIGFLLEKEGLGGISKFKFGMDDSDALIYKKVKYVKGLIKGRKNNVKIAILEYYDIHLALEHRYNQLYYYGWKNLNNKKYKFYVGNKNKM